MNALTDKEDIAKFRIYSLLKGFKLEIETGIKLRTGDRDWEISNPNL